VQDKGNITWEIISSTGQGKYYMGDN